jgi:hypothetical protein
MPEFSRPTAFIDKLLFVQRTAKSATFRNNKDIALRELCEAMTELANALVDREQARIQAEQGQGKSDQITS